MQLLYFYLCSCGDGGDILGLPGTASSDNNQLPSAMHSQFFSAIFKQDFISLYICYFIIIGIILHEKLCIFHNYTVALNRYLGYQIELFNKSPIVIISIFGTHNSSTVTRSMLLEIESQASFRSTNATFFRQIFFSQISTFNVFKTSALFSQIVMFAALRVFYIPSLQHCFELTQVSVNNSVIKNPRYYCVRVCVCVLSINTEHVASCRNAAGNNIPVRAFNYCHVTESFRSDTIVEQ